MPLTAYPKGVSSFGVPVIGAGAIPTTVLGTYFFVDSNNGSDGNSGLDPTHALATVTTALGKCTNAKGDVIICVEGHAESLSGASALNINKSGVTIVGMGRGRLRPTFSFQSAATTIAAAAANVTLDNLVFSASYADVVVGIITSADDITIENCEFCDEAAALNFLTCIATDATNNSSDRLAVLNCTYITPDAATLAFVSVLANQDALHIEGCYKADASAADVGHFIILAAKNATNVRIIRNTCVTSGDNNAQTVGDFMTGSSTASSGVVAYNLMGSLDTTTELFDTAGLEFHHFENYHTGTVAKSGTILPAIE